MATDTRSGFRLPWANAAPEPADEALASETSVPEEAQEPDMIETAAMTEPTVTPEPNAAPELHAEPPSRRATKFMAELSRAMQAAAENARAETMARFDLDAKGVVEQIHASATDEAAALRRQADDDVAAIRDWSKAEIARIREQTEERIAGRKTALDAEMEQHALTVEARTERVAAVVAAFEAEMASFFDRLNAEEDPTRIATMAETMPDPPSLADVAASVAEAAPVSSPTPPPAASQPAVDVDLFGQSASSDTAAAFDFAAAEAEAAAFSGDLDDDELPAEDAATEAAPAETLAVELESAGGADLVTSRVIVSGLESVANIANFKRSLARTAGVSTIGVASGPDGDFVFTVGHTLGSTLAASVQALSGFDIQITAESDDAITVAAQDRDATD